MMQKYILSCKYTKHWGTS